MVTESGSLNGAISLPRCPHVRGLRHAFEISLTMFPQNWSLLVELLSDIYYLRTYKAVDDDDDDAV